jgi:hypothetical protein
MRLDLKIKISLNFLLTSLKFRYRYIFKYWKKRVKMLEKLHYSNTKNLFLDKEF